MRNFLSLIFILFSTYIFSQCTHTIRLTDTFGDGWNGGTVSVSVNGVNVLTNITLSTGAGPLNFNFTASTGSTIRVYRTAAGSWPSEMRVQVVNNTGAILINTIQPVSGTATSLGTTTSGNCQVATPGCTNSSSFGSAVAPTTPTTVTISTCNYQSEYSTVSGITSGQTYQFGYSLGGYITIHTGTFNGPIVAYGNAPLNWASNYTGTVFVHYNTNSSCGTLSSCGTSTVTCVTCSAPVAPTNDLVCNATPIICGQLISGTTVNATNSGTGENSICSVSQTMPGVWYRVTGNGQIMTASLCNTIWDSKISIFSGTSCSALTCVGGIDDNGPSCAGTPASYQWTSVIGLNYYILVHGFSTNNAFQLSLICTTPPPADPTSITTTSNTICNGSSTTLTANGAVGTVYWYTGGCGVTQIGTGNSILVSPSSNQTYWARNFNGSQFSTNCVSTTITVNPSVGTVSNISGNNIIIAGTQETYSITPIAGITYEWSYTESMTSPLWINIPSSNSPSISFTWPQTTTDGAVRVTVANSFSCGTQQKTLLIIVNGALPVELVSFDGNCEEGIVTLNWITTSEHNSDYFSILKSRNGLDWSQLTNVESSGNSTQLIYYSTVDNEGYNGNGYYKLLQVDTDGKSKEYGPINVNCQTNNSGYFSIFPNPNSGQFQILLNNKNLVGECSIIIKDTKGSEILNKEINVKPGINAIYIDNVKSSSGIYYIYISNNIEYTQIVKIEIK